MKRRLRYGQALLLLCTAFLIASAVLLWSDCGAGGWRVTTQRSDAPPAAASEEEEGPAGLLPGEVINLNTAPVEDLSRLPGIGEKRAQAIVDRRTERPFGSVEELVEVEGIGQATLDRLRPYICVTP